MKKLIFLFIPLLTIVACKKPIQGCTEIHAVNYNEEAEEDDGTCTIKFEGIYIVKDSVFYNGDFFENRAYELTVAFLSNEDSLSLKNMGGTDSTVYAILNGANFTIPQQAYDPNAEATGEGSFDFGQIKYELNYGVLVHKAIGLKN